jgi:hypothetical protein
MTDFFIHHPPFFEHWSPSSKEGDQGILTSNKQTKMILPKGLALSAGL